jgi:replication factor C subunit 1
VVEVNASDTRSKSDAKAAAGIGGKLSNVVREMVTSQALAAASGVKRRQVLVMDEVDGMSGAAAAEMTATSACWLLQTVETQRS